VLGRARLVNDPAEKQKRWKRSFAAFWPDRGTGYPLVEVTPARGRFRSGTIPVSGAPPEGGDPFRRA